MGKLLYEILEISENATTEEIKGAYKKMALKWHPDRNKSPNANEMFQKINKANEILMDPEKRKLYDQYGDDYLENPEIINQSMFDDLFTRGPEQFFGMKKHKKVIHIPHKLSLKEIFCNTVTKVNLPKKVKCNECDGTGYTDKKIHTCTICRGLGRQTRYRSHGIMQIMEQIPCTQCNSTGRDNKNTTLNCPHCGTMGFLNMSEEIEVPIPKKILSNNTVEIKSSSIEDTVFVVVFEISFTPEVSISSDGKLIIILELAFAETFCGFQKLFEHPSGQKILIENDAGNVVDPNHIYIIPNKGFPNKHGNDNMYFTFKINYPKKIQIPQKALLSFKNLEKLFGHKKESITEASDQKTYGKYKLQDLEYLHKQDDLRNATDDQYDNTSKCQHQ